MTNTAKPSKPSQKLTSPPWKHKHRSKTAETDSGDSCQKKRRQKRTSVQHICQQNPPPLLPVDNKSTIVYAGPHFMNDAPAPTSLPLPRHTSDLDYSSLYSSCAVDSVSEIQAKLLVMLKIKA